MASSDSDDDAERIARVREMAVSAPKPVRASAGAADTTNKTGRQQVEKSSQHKVGTGNGKQDPRMTSTPPTDGLTKQERKRIKKARQRAEKRQRKELERQTQRKEGEESGTASDPAAMGTTEAEVEPSAKRQKSGKKDKKDSKERKGKKKKKEKKEKG